MRQKLIKTTGWTLSILLAIVFLLSAYTKIAQTNDAMLQANQFHIPINTYSFLGVIEIIALIFFIIPRTGVIGTLLLTAYLGGAIATELPHPNDPLFYNPFIFQILLWISATIRYPELMHRLIQNPSQISS